MSKEVDMIAQRKHLVGIGCIRGNCRLCREIAQLRMPELGWKDATQ